MTPCLATLWQMAPAVAPMSTRHGLFACSIPDYPLGYEGEVPQGTTPKDRWQIGGVHPVPDGRPCLRRGGRKRVDPAIPGHSRARRARHRCPVCLAPAGTSLTSRAYAPTRPARQVETAARLPHDSNGDLLSGRGSGAYSSPRRLTAPTSQLATLPPRASAATSFSTPHAAIACLASGSFRISSRPRSSPPSTMGRRPSTSWSIALVRCPLVRLVRHRLSLGQRPLALLPLPIQLFDRARRGLEADQLGWPTRSRRCWSDLRYSRRVTAHAEPRTCQHCGTVKQVARCGHRGSRVDLRGDRGSARLARYRSIPKASYRR